MTTEVQPKAPTKGDLIIQAYAANPNATRAEIAAEVGCTVARVGEVIRAGLTPDGAGAKKTGTSKGEMILAWFQEHGEGTRKQAAEACECTVGRVHEIIAANGASFTRGDGERRDVWIYSGTADVTAQANVEPLAQSEPEFRTGRCEHERRRKTRTGTCQVCPPVSA